MEHLPKGVKDEEGCFVYQIRHSIGLGVRSEMNVGDDYKTKKGSYKNGQLVSVDLVRPSRADGSRNGPFLRLSDGTGWLFEKKYGEVMMTRIPVSVGLWSFVVDNGKTGIALRRHPIDRRDIKTEVTYKPMQKIHCDRRVQHPETGINFYRVQGTEGWVFDRRRSNNEGEDDHFMLLDENMVETGVFVYECVDSISIALRSSPAAGDDNRTGMDVGKKWLVSVDLKRLSPFHHGNGPFLRLSDGSGWIFEKKHHRQMVKPLLVREGMWELEVMNSPAGIGLRRQPIDSRRFLENTTYKPGTILRCTHKVKASSGVRFYRVLGTDGWVFDKRKGEEILRLRSSNPTSQNGSDFFFNGTDGSGWDPEFVRRIASSIVGVREISFNEQSRVISFYSPAEGGVRINVYYTTRTIGTSISHPSQGATQLFRRNCTRRELRKIFENPRLHTGKGYKRRRTNDAAEIIQTPYGQGLVVDHEAEEAEVRNTLLELDEEIATMNRKRKRLLERIRDADLCRAEEAKDYMEQKISVRNQEIIEMLKKQKEKEEEEERQARELKSRTCEVCYRVFQDRHAKQQHYDAVHVYVYTCDYCDKEFSNPHSLKQHQNALGHW